MTTTAPTPMPIFRNIVRGRRKGLIIWSTALALISMMYVGIYPSMEKMDMKSMIDALPPALVDALNYRDIDSAAGYIGTSVYGMLGLIVMLVFAIGTGSRLIAGVEEEGALELELTSPVSRASIFDQRLAALGAQTGLLAAVVFGVIASLSAAMRLDVSLANLAAASLQLGLVVGIFGAVSFAFGAAIGKKNAALAAGSGLAVGSYMLNVFSKTLDMPWMGTISPISWFIAENSVVHGANMVDVVKMIITSVVIILVGRFFFLRRDLMA